MKELIVGVRNNVIHFFYANLLKKITFLLDPEDVHEHFLKFGRFLGNYRITRFLTHVLFSYKNSSLEQNIRGINFLNPIGLSAGFDKDVYLTDILPHVGFGFAEVGSITGEECKGNPKPRLWRLKNSESLLVYYGLKSEGCEKVSKRLKGKKFSIPIGISVAKTNSNKTVDLKGGIKDYVKAYRVMKNIGSYCTINLSCPNTFGGQPFTDPKRLSKLLNEIKKQGKNKPLFLKLSPDLTKKQIDAILKVVGKYDIDGFICTNLTKNRNNRKIKDKNLPNVGGMSGKIVQNLSDDLIKYIYKKTNGKYVIIGCGGVFTAQDAYKKIKFGASLIQLITGMIYQGPQSISEINRGLVKLLKRDGFDNISEAIGIDVKKA